jgi:hypothetical protein
MTQLPTISTPNPDDCPTCAISAMPVALTSMPPAMNGANIIPTIMAPVIGSTHRPARNGDNPCTSCRYCMRNRFSPIMAKVDIVMTPSVAPKARLRNSSTSMSGSSSDLCRRTNATANATPATTDPTSSQPNPSSASFLMP